MTSARFTVRAGCLGILAGTLAFGCGAPDSDDALKSGNNGGGPVTPIGASIERFAGEIEVRIVDYPDGRSEQRYHLLGAGRPRRLHFAGDPQLEPGSAIELEGRVEGTGIRVDRFHTRALPLQDVERSQRPLVGATALPKRRLAFVLVDLGQGVNLTPEMARARAFGMTAGDQSMRQSILEYSFGRQDLEGEVIGPLKATMSGCDEDGLADSLRDQIPEGFDNIVWYLGRRVTACGWAGIAPLGRPDRIAGELWVNGTAACAVATHEFGHNLGLQHASLLKCRTGPFADVPTGNCTGSEYGDRTDVMGDGCNHVNGYSKAYMRWFEGCNGVRVNVTGSYTLLPMAQACNGIQVLQVPMPKPRTYQDMQLRNYFLELRAPVGLDARITPQVQVRVGSNIVSTSGGRRTGLLDMKPETTTADGLRQGESFQDPAGGVRFTVEALSAGQATVKVEIDNPMMAGPSTCLDGTPLTAPGPPSCGEGSLPPPPTPTPGRPDAGEPAPPTTTPVDAGSGTVTPTPMADAAPPPPPTGGGTTPPPVRPDAGISPPPTSGGNAPAAVESGCSCTVGSTRTGSPAALVVMGVIGLLVHRRRRRR